MMISFERVSKKFAQDNWALADIDLTIEPGEFVFIVGPSGAGKSTLLKLITRELLPTSGVVRVGELEVNSLTASQIPMLRRKVSTIFQDFRLLPDRTVWENVGLALQILGSSQREIEAQVSQILAKLELIDKRFIFPSQLSGGEAQKVVIARSLVAKPEVILADEPTGNLDPATAWSIIQLLQEANAQGTTIVIATHNADLVNSLERRVVRLEEGRMVADQKRGKYVAAD